MTRGHQPSPGELGTPPTEGSAVVDPRAPRAALTDAFAFTIPEAVAVSKIGRSSIYDDIKAGKLEARKRGSKTIILADELVRYLNALPTTKEAA